MKSLATATGNETASLDGVAIAAVAGAETIRSGDVKVLASKAWLESSAVDQLKKAAQLPGMQSVVGLPDLHPGKGWPIGAAFASRELIYPQLVGSDIGCGMAFFGTDLPAKSKADKLIKKLGSIDGAWDGGAAAWLEERGLDAEFERSIGTIGGGNHFAELTAVDTVYDGETLQRLGLDQKALSLLIHSGSRSFGQDVLDRTLRDGMPAEGFRYDSPEGSQYLREHDQAVRWATANRELIAHRVVERLGTESTFVLDLPHNLVTEETLHGESVWLHRKGAAPSDRGVVIIPGSRGTLSYLVVPTGDLESSNLSLAHGAGRKWPRSSCREKLERRFDPESLSRTELGGRVVCEDRNLIYEEAPQAYKDIGGVIEDLRNNGLVKLVASFRPVISYKVKAPSDDNW